MGFRHELLCCLEHHKDKLLQGKHGSHIGRVLKSAFTPAHLNPQTFKEWHCSTLRFESLFVRPLAVQQVVCYSWDRRVLACDFLLASSKVQSVPKVDAGE